MRLLFSILILAFFLAAPGEAQVSGAAQPRSPIDQIVADLKAQDRPNQFTGRAVGNRPIFVEAATLAMSRETAPASVTAAEKVVTSAQIRGRSDVMRCANGRCQIENDGILLIIDLMQEDDRKRLHVPTYMYYNKGDDVERGPRTVYLFEREQGHWKLIAPFVEVY